ncbi:MAG: ABC transporter permease subunit [Anaerolineae bacterium]|jgi:peptide/nickel transport system permease protein
MNSSKQSLHQILTYINSGDKARAANLLAKHLVREPDDEEAWYLLSLALEDPAKQTYCLERALAINPKNHTAAARLAKLPAADAPEGGAEQAAEGMPAADQTAPSAQPHRAGPALAREDSAAAAPVILLPGHGAMPSLKRGRRSWLRTRTLLWWQRFKMDWRAFSESPLALLGLVLIVCFALMAIAHPILIGSVWPRSIYDPVTGYDISVFDHPSLPGPGHLLGTDTLGRDVLSRLLAATTPTFVLGLTAALTTAVVGATLSVTAAYFRGATDALITNMADVFLLLPAPIIMVIIGARFRDLGPVPLGLIYGLVTGAGATAIVMRAHALQVMSRPYMQAAVIAGGSSWHNIFKHLLPAMLPLAAMQMMIAVTGAVVADGFISFFGLTRTTSNWGTIIYDAFVYRGIGGTDRIWHLLLPAAISFSLFALGFYLVSRGLHRVASPTVRSTQNRV